MKKTLLLLLLSNFCLAQTKETKETEETKESRVIKVYTPTTSAKYQSDNSYKWAVKTDLFSFISGEFPIIGEYRVSKKISVEASVAATYSFYENFSILGDEEEDSYTTFETKSAMGSAFRAGFKFYPSSDYDAIEGWAFGIQLFKRTNNRDYSDDDYSGFDLSSLKDQRTKTGIALTISKQVFWDSNITFEYLIGLGIAKINHDYAIIDYNNDTNTQYLREISFEKTVPNLQLGCRIGFGN